MATFKPFVSTDKFSMQSLNNKFEEVVTDFNADNAKIDAALKAVAEGGVKIIIGSYTGTGDSTDTTVTVGFPIKALIITTGNQLDGQNGLLIFSGQTISGGATGQVLWFTEDGFRVKTAIYQNKPCTPYLNTATTHYYIAIG